MSEAPQTTRGSPQRRRRTKAVSGGNGAAPAKPAPTTWVASGDPRTPLPNDLALALRDLGREMDAPVWVLIQNDETSFMDDLVLEAFYRARDELEPARCALLVIDSPGGYPDVAYKIARVFSRHSSGFVAVIPRYAKSAATLLTLGAREVIMAADAEIGPLDAQVYDPEREQPASALDEILALEQLHRVALVQLTQNLTVMRKITRRRFDVVMPHAAKLVSDMMVPLLEKIDSVHYAKQSRLLAVAEEYAVRLMTPYRDRESARRIAKRLITAYPEHGFVIDRREASAMLQLQNHTSAVDNILRRIDTALLDNTVQAFGILKEAS